MDLGVYPSMPISSLAANRLAFEAASKADEGEINLTTFQAAEISLMLPPGKWMPTSG